MKNLLLIVITLILGIKTSSSQDGNFVVITEESETATKIRWMPTSYAIWQLGIEHGYTVIRITEEEEGTVTDTIGVGLKPLAASLWNSEFPNNEAAAAAKKMLYDMSINTAPTQVSSLKDAVDVQEQKEGRHLFAMISAERDFSVAKAMALGYEDPQGGSLASPSYIVVVSDEDVTADVGLGLVQVNTVVEDIVPIASLTSEVDEGYAVLAWDYKDLAQTYTAWDIERSFDGVNFSKVNSQPFRHGYSEAAYEFLVSYQDALPDCSGEVHYRVRGVTPFGTLGPESNTSTVECEENMFIPLYINGTEEKGDLLLVNWRSFDNDYQDSIRGFNIYRTPELTKQVVQLNSTLLPASTREYLDTDPIGSGYYFLEAIDLNDEVHRSNEFFVQKYDKVPPSVPTGLTAEFRTEEVLTVTWSPNPESDMYGYHISVANQRDGQFTRWNDDYIKTPTFTIKLNKGFVTDSVFVKVNALDQFFNASEYSEIVGVARPDVYGPAAPILEFAFPTPDGVALGWSYSGSDDVTKHKLQRRPKTQFEWKDLLIISKDNEGKFGQTIPVPVSDTDANHIDSHNQKAQEYHYRLVAIDDAGNTTPSDWLTVTPFPTAEVTEIKDFKVVVFEEEVPADPALVEQLTNLGADNLQTQLDQAAVTVTSANLTWTCAVNESMAGFIIYRSMTGSSFKPIKELSIAMALGQPDVDIEVVEDIGDQRLGYLDKDLTAGARYSYYIVVKYKNGAESERSTVITKKL